MKAINTTSEAKSAEYIAEQLADAIEEVGSEHVVQVLTDSTAACKSAGALVEKE